MNNGEVSLNNLRKLVQKQLAKVTENFGKKLLFKFKSLNTRNQKET